MAVLTKVFERALTLAAIALGLSLLVSQLGFFSQFHAHLPVRDTYRILPMIEQVHDLGIGSVPWADWVQPHGGAHRIAVTRILMVLDYGWLNGQNHLLYASTWLGLAILVFLYARSARELSRGDALLTGFLCGCILIYLASPSLFFNLAGPINASWYAALAASAIAVTSLTHGDTEPGPIRLAVTTAAALVAAFSHFAGLLVWLLIPALLLLRRSKWTLATACASLLFVGLFLRGMPLSGSGLTSAGDLWRTLGNTAIYLGAPLSGEWPSFASALVGASIVWVLHRWWIQAQRFRQRKEPDSATLLPLAMASICLGVALATQLGRAANPQPEAFRYQTAVMIYWLSVGFLLVDPRRPRALSMSVISILFCSIVLMPATQPLPRELNAIAAARSMEDAVRTAGAALTPDLYAPALPLHGPDFFAQYQGFLKRNQLSVYAEKPRPPLPCPPGLLQSALNDRESQIAFAWRIAVRDGCAAIRSESGRSRARVVSSGPRAFRPRS